MTLLIFGEPGAPSAHWQRKSSINVGSPWRSTLPFPDSNISKIDRSVLAYYYGFQEQTVASTTAVEQNDTLMSVAVLPIKATVNVDISDTLSASARVTIIGTVQFTEIGDIFVSASNLPILGSSVIYTDNDSVSSTGYLAIKGSINIVERNDISVSAEVGVFEPRLNIIYARNATNLAVMLEQLDTIGVTDFELLENINVIITSVLSPAIANQLSQAVVEPDIDFFVSGTQTLTGDDNWGLDRIDKPTLPLDQKFRFTRQAPNVDVYVVDTGVQIFHKDFSNRGVVPRANRLYDYRVDLEVGDPNRILPNSAGYAIDDNGHGTLIASIIGGLQYGVAKQVNLKSVKVFNKNGISKTSWLLRGLDAIVADFASKSQLPSPLFVPSIVNMSFSTHSGSESSIFTNVVEGMMAQGILFVGSAGNDSLEITKYSGNSPGVQTPTVLPGSINDMITVGSIKRDDSFLTGYTDSSGQIRKGSNFGTGVDVYAPGYQINGAWRSEAKDLYGTVGQSSGSSVAAAFATGIAALYMEGWYTMYQSDPQQITQQGLKQFIIDSASLVGVKGLPEGSNDRILRNLFVPGDLQWVTPPGLLFTVEEDQPIRFQLEAKNLDVSRRAMPIEYLFANFSEQQELSQAGVALTGEGLLYGTATQVDVNDPNYVLVNSLPEDERGIFPPNIRGYLDLTFDGLIQDQLSKIQQSSYTSQTRTFVIRILDVDVAPYWVADGLDTVDITALYPAGTFDVGQTIVLDFASNIIPYAVDPDGDQLEFSLLVGQLPPGLTLNAVGTLMGTLQAYPKTNSLFYRTYNFTVRAYDGRYFVDKQCSITVTRTIATNNPPVWNLDTVPVGPIGTYKLGQGVSARIEAFDVDGDVLTYGLTAPTLVPAQNYPGMIGYNPALPTIIYGLPPNTNLTETGLILGNIRTTAIAGQYYTGVTATDGFATITATIMIEVKPFLVDSDFVPIPKLEWVTPAGSLGEIDETYPSWFQIEATANSVQPLVYELTNNTELPEGLTLDSITGRIQGIVDYVGATQVVEFSAKAYIQGEPLSFISRDFSITVNKKYTAPISNFVVSLFGPAKQEILDFIASSSIFQNANEDQIYRPDDPNYGIKTDLSLYVLGGLPVMSPADIWAKIRDDLPLTDPATWNRTNVTPVSNFHRTTLGVMGSLQTAKARDSFGNVLYEVLYVPVYDPSYRAGGFDANGAPSPIPYAQQNPSDPISPKFIFPTAINNWRNDLQQEPFEMLGEERLPLWMTSEQIVGDPTSILGYTPCLELMYLNPGDAAQYIITSLELSNFIALIRNRPILVDRYVWENLTDPSNVRRRHYKFPPGNISF